MDSPGCSYLGGCVGLGRSESAACARIARIVSVSYGTNASQPSARLRSLRAMGIRRRRVTLPN